MTFDEIQTRLRALRAQLAAREVSLEAFDAACDELRLQDGVGRWWSVDRDAGTWLMHDGTAWVPGVPPSAAPAPAPPRPLRIPTEAPAAAAPSNDPASRRRPKPVPVRPTRRSDAAAPAAVPVRRCAACGQIPEAGDRFCAACGGRLAMPAPPPRLDACTSCGEPVSAGQKFCEVCGRALG